MNHLRVILNDKRDEVKKLKDLIEEDTILRKQRKPLNFKGIFKKGGMAFIAEIKKMSPSIREIVKELDVEKIAQIYESSGVDAISVVTDKKYFGGDCSLIKDIKRVVKIPVLRKDFIIDEVQIYQTYDSGSDAILLIAGILNHNQLKRFVKIARSLGLETVVEVHNLREIHKALDTDTEIIGVNNRNLRNFVVDINVSLRLRPFIPQNYFTISESGIEKPQDVQKLRDAGFDGILVGTSILKAEDISKKIKELKWKNF
jgi:indole-3-glycerol phosphate synthase|uniref:Indole-3-glycerol phosphate synthase n=1 Tax=candidate division WOR-3 bacterium TaxID=2052148 RepID=A0A7V3VTS0_UNCW3